MAESSDAQSRTPGQTSPAAEEHPNQTAAKVLCVHCKRTAENGIRCQGICVADNDY